MVICGMDDESLACENLTHNFTIKFTLRILSICFWCLEKVPLYLIACLSSVPVLWSSPCRRPAACWGSPWPSSWRGWGRGRGWPRGSRWRAPAAGWTNQSSVSRLSANQQPVLPGLEHGLVGEGVDGEQTQQVTQLLRQRQEREQSERRKGVSKFTFLMTG